MGWIEIRSAAVSRCSGVLSFGSRRLQALPLFDDQMNRREFIPLLGGAAVADHGACASAEGVSDRH